MNAATRAHTVPKFYLRGFVAPESEASSNACVDPYVWLGSLTSGEIKRRSPKNIRHQKTKLSGLPSAVSQPRYRLSPAIVWANTQRWSLPARWILQLQYGWCAGAVS